MRICVDACVGLRVNFYLWEDSFCLCGNQSGCVCVWVWAGVGPVHVNADVVVKDNDGFMLS